MLVTLYGVISYFARLFGTTIMILMFMATVIVMVLTVLYVPVVSLY